MYMDKAKDRLEELDLHQKLNMAGCTRKDIQTIESRMRISLPIAYQEFLLWMGHASQLFKGNDYSCADLLNLQQIAADLLEENQEQKLLPTDAFVFLVHQGYQFDFFRLSEGDDPPVYWYCEGKTDGFIQTHQHFSDYLLTSVEGYARIIKEIAGNIEKIARINPQRAREMAERNRREGNYDGSF